jgi:hypothetical protein
LECVVEEFSNSHFAGHEETKLYVEVEQEEEDDEQQEDDQVCQQLVIHRDGEEDLPLCLKNK